MTHYNNDGRLAVLFVDHEAQNLTYFNRAFAQDFQIIVANNALEAREILATSLKEIGVLITDQRMSGESGVDLLCYARENFPHMVRILTTAYADLRNAVEAVNNGEVFRYITKPWDIHLLQQELRLALRFFTLQREHDVLLKENLSVKQRLSAMDRLRDLIVIATSLSPRLRHTDSGLTAFLEDIYALEGEQPIGHLPKTAGKGHLNLWNLPQIEACRMRDITQHIVQACQGAKADFQQTLYLPELLQEIQAAMEPLAAEQNKSMQLKYSLGLGAIQGNVPVIERMCTMLVKQMLHLTQPGSSLAICVKPMEAVGGTPGVCVGLAAKQAGWDGQNGSLLFTLPSGELSPLMLQTELLACYLLAYHHGGRISLKENTTDIRLKVYLPYDPLAGKMEALDDNWIQKLYTRYEYWDNKI